MKKILYYVYIQNAYRHCQCGMIRVIWRWWLTIRTKLALLASLLSVHKWIYSIPAVSNRRLKGRGIRLLKSIWTQSLQQQMCSQKPKRWSTTEHLRYI